MSITLSVIIPIYNVEPYIKKCIGSIVHSVGTYAVEVLLIDDGSTDHSGEIADAYARKYSYIHVIHQPNGGVACARNVGIERAEGKWLYFMDSDDWLAKDGIALIHRAIERHSEADMILFDAWQNTGTRQKPWEHFSTEAVWNQADEIYRLQRGVLYFSMERPKSKVPLAAPWDKVYNKQFLQRNGIAFCDKLQVLDDMIFNMEVLGKAACVSYEKRKIYHYRCVTSSITNKYHADRVQQDRAVWNYIREYRDRQSVGSGWDYNVTKSFDQAYYCRIIRSFTICSRLHFYHRDNLKPHSRKQAYVREVLKSAPYAEAFRKVRLRNLEWKLQIVSLLVRLGLYRGLYLLHLAESIPAAVTGRRRSAG